MRCWFLIALLYFCLPALAQKNKSYFPAYTFHKDSVTVNGIAAGLWTVNFKPRHNLTNGVRLELLGIGLGVPLVPKSPLPQNKAEFLTTKKDTLSERVNGFNLSGTGSVCACRTNGVVAGLIGQIHNTVNGISVTGMMNFATQLNGIMLSNVSDAYKLNGLQGGMASHATIANGLQISFVGNGSTKMRGIQIGGFNYAEFSTDNTNDYKPNMPNLIGMQIGLKNKAQNLSGIQIGLFNKSQQLKGLQLGLWNVNNKRKLPILNWNFKNG
jgi:hypothetical protein